MISRLAEWVLLTLSIPQLASALVMVIAGCALSGWLLDIEALRSIIAGLPPMMPVTALIFMLSGAVLWRSATGAASAWLTRLGAWLVILIALLTLLEYLLSVDLGMDLLLFRNHSAYAGGRMAPQTAVNFLLAGGALLWLDRPAWRGVYIVPYLAAGIILIALLALVGLSYRVTLFYGYSEYISLSLPAALAFLALGAGLLAVHPEHGFMALASAPSAGGVLLRRLLPVAIMVPLVLGWLRILGQRLGLFDTDFGAAFMTVMMIALLSAFIWHVARALQEAHAQLERRIEERTALLAASAAALRDSQAQLRSQYAELELIYQHSPVGLCVLDRDFRFVRVNERLAEINGIPAAEHIGRTIREIVPELADTLEPIYRQVLDTSAAVLNREVHGATPSAPGVERYWLASYFPVQTADGLIQGIGCVAEEITERKRMEQDLLESEARFRSVLLNIPVPVIVHTLDGEIIEVSRAFTEQTGYTRQDLPDGRTWLVKGRRVPQDQVEATLAKIQQMFTAGAPIEPQEATVWTKAGAPRQWLFHGSEPMPLSDGRRLVVSTAIDITERQRIEEALRESESHFRSLAEAMPQIVYTTTPDGQADYVNQRWYEYTGATDARGLQWASHLHPNEAPQVLERWAQCIRSGEPFSIEYRYRKADGSYGWHSSCAAPVRDAAGNIAKWVGTSADITGAKLVEQALKDADHRKDEFLAMLAHELRNPLAPIRNAVQILNFIGPQEPRLQQARDIIERQVKHMARLVDDLLDISRIARGKIELRSERLDLAALVRQAAEDYRSLLESSGLTLALELPEAPLWVDGDPARLAQMVSNLLHNAYKFTPAGGRVAVRARATRDRAVVSVRDTGIGIKPELLGQVFDRFSQAEHGLARSRGGLGLGLALVKGLAQLHGGAVSAVSAGSGRGATFTFRLPLSAAPASSPEQTAPAALSQAGCRVLVIEDNRDAAESLAVLLTLSGYEVRTAHTGRHGLEIARAFLPQVVLCDIGLPDFDGYAVARTLRREPALRSVYLIALTGYGREEDQHQARTAGFDLHILKPVEYEQLRQALATLPAPASSAGAGAKSHDFSA